MRASGTGGGRTENDDSGKFKNQTPNFKITDDHALPDVEAHCGGRVMEVSVWMKRLGGEWRFDGIQRRKLLTAAEI